MSTLLLVNNLNTMKKNILFIITIFLLCFSFQVKAQKIVNVSASTGGGSDFYPNTNALSFTEPVTIVVDISGVPALVAEEAASRSIYLWGFIQGCCGSSRNGDWTSSNEANVMTKVSTNKWSITLPSIKEFMQATFKQAKDAALSANPPRTATETRFGFLVKGKDGSGNPEKKSKDMEIGFLGPIFVPSVYSAFPANFAQGDVVTFTFDKNLETNTALKALNEFYIYMEADVKVGTAPVTVRIPVAAANVGNTPSLKMTAAGGTKFTFTTIPSRYFTLAAGETITEVRVIIQSRTDANVNSGIKKNPVFIAK